MTSKQHISSNISEPRQDHDSERGRMSSVKFSPKRHALSYRAHFITCWQRFVRTNFDSKEHVAMVFGVDGSTAGKWWDGLHAPSGFAVGYAFAQYPDEAKRSLGEAA